jgi:hypothetical protein
MHWLQARASAVRYRVGGLPPSIRYWRRRKRQSPQLVLRHVEARRYWRIATVADAFDTLVAVLLAPIFVIGAAVWHTARAGRIHAARCGRHPVRQFFDQLRIYLSSGIMPATYYIFDLVDNPTNTRARAFLKRAEMKGLIYPLVRRHMPPKSSLNDKGDFEKRCRDSGLPAIPTLAVVRNGMLSGQRNLPPQDLFVKPLGGKGGRGAERWTWAETGYQGADGQLLSPTALAERLHQRSYAGGLIVQPCLRNDDSLAALSCGALATIRILTCQNEDGRPEVIGAALRMSIDPASVVDNLHQGGITAVVDVETGRLGAATNLGKDARVGWHNFHPVTGTAIAGRVLDCWTQVRALAVRAQEVFADRLFVGWDITMTPDGPVIVEGNSAPGLDIFQRPARSGMGNGRFAELLAARMIAWGEYAPVAA